MLRGSSNVLPPPIGRPARAPAVLVVLVLAACAGEREGAAPAGADDPAAFSIAYRQFSPAPSLARGQGSSDLTSEDYGALRVFTELVEARTAALGPGRKVVFSLVEGPATFSDVANDGVQAAHLSGGSLDAVWGFLYNSIPFGPTFAQMIEFLHDGGGVALANRIYAERGVDVVAFPVVGSPPQGSGYFKRPVGVPECPASGDPECERDRQGIGLRGLCAESWTLRYLPPAETIVDLACDGIGSPQRVEFVQAIPGGSAFLTAIQKGAVDGFEFATPLDDYDARSGGFFANPEIPAESDGRNVGEVGLRFLHSPAWHQPFFLGWMVLARTEVWDRLEPDQRAAIEEAARESVVESFERSLAVECDALRRILDANDGRSQRSADGQTLAQSADVILTRWRSEDLDRLREAAREVIERPAASAAPGSPEGDYTAVLQALLRHLGQPSVSAMLGTWSEETAPAPGGCPRTM